MNYRVLPSLLIAAFFFNGGSVSFGNPPSKPPGLPPNGPPKGGPPRKHPEVPFSDLSEEDRKKIKDALAKVWESPEVQKARSDLMIANEHYRDTLHAALAGADPAVAPVLAQMFKNSPNFPGYGSKGLLKEVMTENFPQAAVPRMFREMRERIRGQREGGVPELETLQKEFVASDEVDGLIEKLAASDLASERLEIFRQLRQNLHEKVRTEYPELAKYLPNRGTGERGERGKKEAP